MRIETLAVHAGIRVDPTTGAVVPPLHTATTFEHEPDSTAPRGYLYSRTANPNRNALEECLSELEGGAGAVAFASASAATAAVFQALAPGDHVVAPLDAYFGTGKLLRDTFMPWGLAVDFVDMTDAAAIKAALRPRTKIVWVETPSNPLWRVTDVAAVAALAHGAGAACVCDNTSARRCSSGRWRSAPTWPCTRRPSTSAATATCWAAPWWRGRGMRSSIACAPSRARAARSRRRSTAGSSAAASARCRGACAPTRDNALTGRDVPGRAPARRGRALPGPREPPAARRRAPPDDAASAGCSRSR